ncbi:autotransporter outer membrane beta-barrel domain-containing protein [Camelimonas lactis]|uniref:Outer membrane autotransporter protein n=1 Tax=Camelimonas lactis TaxID=659006 RepID=A0A4R2GXF0_9HYPH|nr:autotransporter outer membrane beta-barrel domain-containing protein [Camelimonas lactis]TCO15899.1 outer membrane autotransporter protein [Camelimonas lactis]
MARLKITLTSTTAMRLLSGVLAAPAILAGASQARADCTTANSVTTCTTAAVNPYPNMIGTGPGDDNHTVMIESGASIATSESPAISLGDGAMITIRSGGHVTNNATNFQDGPWGTGNNTIEFGSNGRLLIEAGASVTKTGGQDNAEAINVHGAGNVITNYGLIQTENSRPIWFQDETTGERNVVDNYGSIIRTDGSYLFGSSTGGANAGIVLINRTGALLQGDVVFLDGDDDLHIHAGSTIIGDVDGGGGFNSLFLDGAAGTQDQIASHVANFQALIKDGAGQWTVTGSLDGYQTTTVRDGLLTLTGDNSDYQGDVLVGNAGVLEARAQSMPVRVDPAANLNNIQNDGVVRFTQPAGDDATYVGQITGAGVVEKTGDGVLTLAPDAPAGNAYAGGTIIRGGVVAAAADSALGAASGPLTLDGGAFRFTSSYALSARAVTITASNGAFDVVAGAAGSVLQAITGPGALTKSGDGTLILAGDNTWAGGTTIAAGVLQLGNGGASGSLVGDVDNQAQLVFNRSDAWTYAGVISGAGAVTQAGPGTTILTGANAWSGGTTITAGTLQLGDGGATGSLVGDVLNDGQLAFNRSNTYAFDGVISGSGAVTQAGAGMTLLSNVNTWTGPTQVLAGTLAVGGPDSMGAAITGAGAIGVAAGATLGGYGSVAGDTRNDGVIAVANALSAFSGGPTGNFTIGGQLTNAGLVRLGGAGVGNTLTVGSYTGVGGVIALNTYLGSDGSPSDRLIINGGAGTGSTTLAITNVGGPGAATPGNGILVVSAINGAATAANAFSAGNLVAGPYEYTLYRGSRDASDPESWYLRSEAQSSGGNNGGRGGDGGGGGGGGGPVIPDFRKETSLYAALPSMALLYGQTMLGTLHERVGEQELQRGLSAANGSPLSRAVWGRVIGSHGNNDGDGRGVYGSGPAFTWDFYAFQIGMDLYRKEHADGSRDHAGIYIGAGHADGSARHYTGIRAGDMRFDGYTVGAYWTHYGATGWYVDAVAQGTWYSDVKTSSGRLTPLSTSGFGVALSLETGYPFALGDGWVLEPQAQIVLQKINFDGGYDGASYVRFSDVQSVAARVGARLSKTWVMDTAHGPVRLNAWLRGNIWNEFAGVPKANFSSELGYVPFRSDMKGAWADISAGVTAQFNASAALYAAVSYQTSFDGRRDGWSGKAGLRFTW